MATAEEIAQRDAEDSIEQVIAKGEGRPKWGSVDQNVIERMVMLYVYDTWLYDDGYRVINITWLI